MAKKYGLQVNELGIGQSCMVAKDKRANGKTEILLTNYEAIKQLKIW